jgi:hypothetical protein
MMDQELRLVSLDAPNWAFDVIDSYSKCCGRKFRDPEDYVALIRVGVTSFFLHNTPRCAKEIFWIMSGSNPELAQNQYEMWQIMEQEARDEQRRIAAAGEGGSEAVRSGLASAG